MNKLLKTLIARVFYVPQGNTVSKTDRIESARITSTKLKALRPKPEGPDQNCTINRLLAKAAALYKELKEQKAASNHVGLLDRLDNFGH
ncbi:MAG TPA: hypothetical protein V6C81_31060 [Planktothrix sp.]|jgi:hypothetical protein